ncbi:ATP-binding protein [Streptomyces noursei]|uniref:ATP-binding protein n=1 Tax=Streptomyces noursei TaxID=1971 RepID=UPI0030F0AB6A
MSLNETQRARTEPLLPDRTPKQGGRWRDHHETIDAIAFTFQTATQWVHLPMKYGNWQGLYNRLRIWAVDGTWERACTALIAKVDAPEDRRLASREQFACLPEPWTLGNFDFTAPPGVDEKLIRDLATLRFLDDASNVLLVAPPGVGKTMLSVALGRAAVDAGHRVYFTTATELAAKYHKAALEGRWKTCMRFFSGPRLLITDELGYLPLPDDGASALFQVINHRHPKSSTILTTNVGIDGPSYRLRGHQHQADVLRKGVNARVS